MQKNDYQKPQIRQVELVAQDSVLANCKSATGTNRSTGRCREVGNCTNKIVGS